jgi:hypothetical protein
MGSSATTHVAAANRWTIGSTCSDELDTKIPAGRDQPVKGTLLDVSVKLSFDGIESV